MSRARKGTIGWELVAGQWMQRTAAFILSLTLVEALHAQSSTSITNPTLVNGNVTWTDLGGGNWQFTVGSQSAIINFTSFGIPDGAVVQFLMNPDMRVLNRVIADFPTQINGSLLASGQIFIVNPAGVFIGANGVVNVGSLYAAAGDVTDAAFGLDGSPVPSSVQATNIRGEVRNEGLIQAATNATLIGTRVVNLGVGPARGIVVGAGGVALMVSHNGDVTVFEPGSNPQLFAVSNAGANIGGVGVENSGRIEVGAGGQIQLGAGDVYSVAIRNTGALSAQDGQIRMVGRDIEQSGGELTTASLVVGGNAGAANQMTLSGAVNADTAQINAGTVALNGATTFRGQGGAGDQATSVLIIGDVRSSGGTQAITFDSATTAVTGALGGTAAERLDSVTASGDLNALGAMRVANDVSVAGSAFVGGTLDLGGNAVVGNALNVVGDLNLDNAAAAQSVSAGGALSVTGGVASLKDAFLSGASLFVGGSATSGEALGLTATAGNLSVGGNAIAATDLTIATAGDVAVGGNAAAGGSALIFGNSVAVTGDAVATAGSLTIAAGGGNANVGGGITAGTDVNFIAGGTASVSGDLTAGGNAAIFADAVALGGNATATSGSLTISAGSGDAIVDGDAVSGSSVVISSGAGVSVGGNVTAANNATLSGSAVAVTGDVTATTGALSMSSSVGDTSVGGAAVAGGDINVNSSGNVLIGAAASSGANLTVSSLGNTSFGGAVSAGDALTVVAGGTASAASVTAASNVLFFGNSVAIAGDASSTGATLSVSSGGGNVNVGGNVSAATDAFLTTSGDVSVGGSVTAGNSTLIFGNAVNVTGGVTTTTGQLTMASGGGNLSVGGNVSGGTDVLLSGGSAVSVGGDVKASGNAQIFGSSVSVAGGATATSGALFVSASLGNANIGGAASAGTDVVVSAGGNATLGGNVNAGSSVNMFAGSGIALGGDVLAVNGVTLDASGNQVALNGLGAQVVRADNGALFINGAVSKTGGDLTLDAGTTLGVTGNAQSSGAMTTSSVGASSFGGNVGAGTDLTVLTPGDVTIAGTASAGDDVSIMVGGALSAGGVTAANNATLSGRSVAVTGNAAATGGTLAVTATGGNATIGGAATGSNVNLTASGAVSASSVTAANNATLNGASVNVTGNAAATGGTLAVTATGGNATIGGAATGSNVNLTASGAVSASSVTAANNATLNGSSVAVTGNAAATGGTLAVTATGGNATIGGAATAGTNVSLTASGSGTFRGDVIAGDDVNVVASSVNFGGDVEAANDVTINAAGGTVNFNGSGAQTVLADNGAIIINGVVTKVIGAGGGGGGGGGSLVPGVTAGNLILDAGTTIDVTGPISATGSVISTSVGASSFGGAITAGDDITMSGGSLRLNGSLTAGTAIGDNISLTGPIVLNAADSAWTANRIFVNGSIDGAAAGAQTLRLRAADRSVLDGGIGGSVSLGEFRIENGFTQLGSVAGGTFTVNADRFTLAPASRPSDVGVDLGSSGNLVVNAPLFTMAQGSKATILGDFTINSGAGTARLSDVNTTGVFEVTAGSIQLVARDGSGAMTSIGTIDDSGLDFISLGGFKFSVAPVLDGAGSVRFASPNATGDLNGTLVDFVMLNINDSELGLNSLVGGVGVSGADFRSGTSFFDLVADGTSSTSSATTSAVVAGLDIAEMDTTIALSAAERERLQAALGGAVEVRWPDPVEAREIGSGSVAFRDGGRLEAAALASRSDAVGVAAREAGWRRPLSASAQRFELVQVRRFLVASDAIRAASPEAVQAAAQQIVTAYRAGTPLADVVQGLRTRGAAEELAAVQLVANFIRTGESLGLSDTERTRAGAGGMLWPQSQIGALGGGADFNVPASAFDGGFWMSLDQPIATR